MRLTAEPLPPLTPEVLPLSDFIISDGPFSTESLRRWSAEVRTAYPDWKHDDNRGPALLADITEQVADGVCDSYRLTLSFAEDTLVGLLAYLEDEEDSCFSLISFAVAPQHQRQGIGSALLGHLQTKAKNQGYFIVASGLLPPAAGCFGKAGFRVAGTSFGGSVYKWSCLAEHEGDDWPGKDPEEEDGGEPDEAPGGGSKPR